MKHGPLYPERVFYPVTRPKNWRAISKAVEEVVSKMKPSSLCVCGKFCSTHERLAGNGKAKSG